MRDVQAEHYITIERARQELSGFLQRGEGCGKVRLRKPSDIVACERGCETGIQDITIE